MKRRRIFRAKSKGKPRRDLLSPETRKRLEAMEGKR